MQLLFSRLELEMLWTAPTQQTELKITHGALEEFPVVSEAVEFLKRAGEQCEALGCCWAFPAHLMYGTDPMIDDEQISGL